MKNVRTFTHILDTFSPKVDKNMCDHDNFGALYLNKIQLVVVMNFQLLELLAPGLKFVSCLVNGEKQRTENK